MLFGAGALAPHQRERAVTNLIAQMNHRGAARIRLIWRFANGARRAHPFASGAMTEAVDDAGDSANECESDQ